jgi:outer membrane protein assembly factor BamB
MNMSFTLNGLVVSQRPDGTYSWSGSYEGVAVKTAIPLGNGTNWIVLLDPDASQSPTFENLLCVDLQGRLLWKAKLPTYPDAYLSVTVCSGSIWAGTWSGFKVKLDPNTGTEIERIFVK